MCISNALFPVILLSLSITAFAQSDQGIKASNVVSISENLVTAGQPTAESLVGLSKLGFQAVIYRVFPAREHNLSVVR
jgi:hypothetical protein